MANESTSPDRPKTSTLWGLIFWVTFIHFVIFGFMLVSAWPIADISTDTRALPWRTIGIVKASAYWIFEYRGLLISALCVADLAALMLTWSFTYLTRQPRLLIAYFIYVSFFVTINIASSIYLVNVGTLPLKNGSITFPRSDIFETAMACLIFALPAWMILLGVLFIKRRDQPPGICVNCGYDLRASKERCPECGMDIKPSHS